MVPSLYCGQLWVWHIVCALACDGLYHFTFTWSFWDTNRIPHDQVNPSQTHRCPEGLCFPPKWSRDHYHIQPHRCTWVVIWLFCFRSTPQRSLILGPLSRVHFGESLVNRLYSESDHTYLSIEAQCVSQHYPRWTATISMTTCNGKINKSKIIKSTFYEWADIFVPQALRSRQLSIKSHLKIKLYTSDKIRAHNNLTFGLKVLLYQLKKKGILLVHSVAL